MDRIDELWLKEAEDRDNLFWDMNCVKYYLEKSEFAQPVIKKRSGAPKLGKASSRRE
jgi:hypothetical protein